MTTRDEIIDNYNVKNINIIGAEIFTYLDPNAEGFDALYFVNLKSEDLFWPDVYALLYPNNYPLENQLIIGGKQAKEYIELWAEAYNENVEISTDDGFLVTYNTIIIIKDYFKDNGTNRLKYILTADEATETSGKNVYDMLEDCLVLNTDTVKTVETIGREIIANGTAFNDVIDLRKSHAKGIVINADSGIDYIYGSVSNDTIYAGDGNDIIDAGKGDDIIYGGKGDDYIIGGAGNNRVEYSIDDGLDTLKLSYNEQLTVNVNTENVNEMSYKLDGDDVYITRTYIPEGEEEEVTENCICIKDFANRNIFTKSPSPVYGIGSSNGVAGFMMLSTVKERPYVPAFNVDLTYNNDVENLINLNTQLYEVDLAGAEYSGKWVDEKIDASGAGSGVTIDAKEGDDVIIGSEHDDTLKGNWGSNTIVYSTQDFGNDTILLTAGENLKIDVSEIVGQTTFSYPYIEDGDLIIKASRVVVDPDTGLPVLNPDTGMPEIIESSITLKDFGKKDVVTSKGSVKWVVQRADEEHGIEEISYDLKEDVTLWPIPVVKNYNGTWLSDDVTAQNAEKGVTIKTGSGGDIIRGSAFDDYIVGGTGRNTIRLYTQTIFGNDTVGLTKGETLYLKLCDEDDIGYTDISLDGNNFVVKVYNEPGYTDGFHNGDLQGQVTIKNYKKSDVVTDKGGFLIVDNGGNVLYNVREDFYIDTVMDNDHYTNSTFNGSWMNDNVNAEDSVKGVTIKSGNGNDIITGSQFSDNITGGLGTNTIIVANEAFGKDTITLTKNENLILDMSAYPWNLNDLKNHLEVSGNNLLIKVDDDNVLTLKNFTKSNVVGANGSVKVQLAEGLPHDLNNEELLSYTEADFVYNNKKHADVFNGSRFNERITSTDSDTAAIISGGAGYNNIVLTGTENTSDTITGGNDGNNINIEKDGAKTVTTGKGDDIVDITGNGVHTIKSGDGENTISVNGDGKLTITTGKDDDQITIENNNSQATIKAGNGDNIIEIISGTGTSSITTGNGADTITLTNNGNSTINSGDGNDVIETGSGADTINAGSGDDTIDAGEGDDKITGGKGYDTFIFNTGDGSDIITDTDFSDCIKLYCDPETVRYSKNGNNLVINYGDTDKVTLNNYFKQKSENTINEIFVNDELQENWKNEITNIIEGKGKISDTPYNDTITGSNSNDTYTIKNAGNDTVQDASGNDKYTISKTEGSIDITDNAGNDTYTVNSLDSTIVITDDGGTDSLIIKNYNSIIFAFNVDKNGNILQDELAIAKTQNDLLEQNFSIVVDNYYNEGTIETIKLGSTSINLDIIKQNVVTWLNENDYDNTLDVIQNSHQPSDIPDLITLYTYNA